MVYIMVFDPAVLVEGSIAVCRGNPLPCNLVDCSVCQQTRYGVDVTCNICRFFSEKNAEWFGMLTQHRAHSPVSFKGATLIFKPDQIKLLTSYNYMAKFPTDSPVQVSTERFEQAVVRFLTDPYPSVWVRGDLRIEQFMQNLMLSCQQRLYVTLPNQVLMLEVQPLQDLLAQLRGLDPAELLLANSAMDLFEQVIRNKVIDRMQMQQHAYWLKRLSDNIGGYPASRLFAISILKVAINEGDTLLEGDSK